MKPQRQQSAGIEQEKLLPLDIGLTESNDFLVRMRWYISAAVAVGSIAARLLGYQVPLSALLMTALLIGFYNFVYRLYLDHLKAVHHHEVALHVQFVNVQIALDWIMLTVVLHYTGGIESPVIFLYFLHVVLASILLDPHRAFHQAVFGSVLVSALGLGEMFGLIPPVLLDPYWVRQQDPGLAAPRLIFFALGFLATQFSASRISISLRDRERQQQSLEQALHSTVVRLHGLAESAHAVNATLDVQKVVETMAQTAPGMLGAQSCAIYLNEDDKPPLTLAARHGMSESEAALCREILLGLPEYQRLLDGAAACLCLKNTSNEPELPRVGELAAAGILSLLATPVSAQKTVLGLAIICGDEPFMFDREEAEYMHTLADMSASSLVNARQFRQLEELERSKSEMLWTVTHELRSPLAAVSSLLKLILDGYVGDAPEQTRKMVERAYARTQSLIDTVSDLLAIAKGRLDSLKEDLEPLDMGELVEQSVELFLPQAQEKQIELSLTRGHCAISLKMIREEAERLVSNLLSNAVKYTPSGGRVDVRLACDGEKVTLTVADTGIGIPDDAREKVFEGFYRAKNARALNTVGTGLGLAIVQRIVEKYRGALEWESKVNEGTRFTIILPFGATS